MFVIDSEIRQAAVEPKVLKKKSDRASIAFRPFPIGQAGVDTEDVGPQAFDLPSVVIVHDVLEPARDEDSQTVAMGNVIDGRQFVFHAVARRHLRHAASQKAVEGPRRGPHKVGPGFVVIRFFEGNRGEGYDGLQTSSWTR